MPKIWVKNRGSAREKWVAVREAVGPTARGALCPREAHAPPTAWGDVASADWPILPLLSPPFISLLSLHLIFKKKKLQYSRQSSPLNFLIFKTSYLPHPESDLSDSNWRTFIIESSIISKWCGGCFIDFSCGSIQKFKPARESKVLVLSLGFLSF